MVTVLVVGASADERNILSQILGAQNWRILEASDGRTAVEILSKFDVQCVLLDAELRDIDAFEFIRHIRRLSSVPVAFMAARRSEAEMVKALSSGADDYIVKPYSPAELVARMRAMMKRWGSRG